MTTTVIVQAHVSEDKEVKVTITDDCTDKGCAAVEEITLQDGESTERHVYDGREIVVKEVLK